MKVRKGISRSAFWPINIIASLLAFIVMYGFLNSGALFAETVKLLYGNGRTLLNFLLPEAVFTVLCKYGRDFALGYMLVMGIGYWLRDERHSMKKTLIISLIAETAIELVRMAVVISEVLAPWNFLVKLLGTFTAFLVVLYYEKKLF